MSKKIEDLVQNSKGTRFTKGVSGNPNGRPKKLETLLKEDGLSVSTKDMREMLMRLSQKSSNELEKIYKDKDTPIIMKAVAKSLNSGEKKGLKELDKVMPYIFGAIKQEMEITKIETPYEKRFKEIQSEKPELSDSEINELMLLETDRIVHDNFK